MNAKTITDALALAAWELAEAESTIRRAENELRKARRQHGRAASRLAQLHEQVAREIITIQNHLHERNRA
jgi:prefoldin subunit 5